MLDRNYLVCALASHPDAVPGSVFDRSCSSCNQRVMIAPSGQHFLKRDPATAILCVNCMKARIAYDDPVTLATNHEEAAREAAAKQPNLRRQRN